MRILGILITVACTLEILISWYKSYFQVQKIFDPPPFRWIESNLSFYRNMTILSYVMAVLCVFGLWFYFNAYAAFIALGVRYLVGRASWFFNFNRKRLWLADIFYLQIRAALSGKPTAQLQKAVSEYNFGVTKTTQEMHIWNEEQLRNESVKRADEWIKERMSSMKI